MRRTTGTMRLRRISVSAALIALAGLSGISAPAFAAEGSIDHVERDAGSMQVLFSLPGAGDVEPDLDSLTVSLDDNQLDAKAELAADAVNTVRRTAILTIDVSNSMRKENRFEEAQQAAKAFLDAAPEDLYIGIVTFANEVTVAQPPSLDRDASAQIIDGLELSKATHLYDGLLRAVKAAGTEGARSLLLLSDGRDTTDTDIETVTQSIDDSDVKVDVVALSLPAEDQALLQQIADAGNGSVVSADPESLTQVFSAEADTLARQVLITATLPDDNGVTEGTLAVSVDANGEAYTDTAFVTVSAPKGAETAKVDRTKLVPVQPNGFQVSKDLMLLGIGGAGLGLLVLLMAILGVFGGGKDTTVEDRISAYTRKGARKLAASRAAQAESQQGVTAQAVGIAEKALEGREGLATALGTKLEAAGMSIKPAEWLLTHAAIAFLGGLIALLLSSGSILFTVVGLFFGLLLPWAYLSFKRSRRLKAFKYSLADTLQLMAGSLSAGLSLAQSVDTVVREGQEPIAGEFRRALVEARLGVEIEDAMDGVAKRMESVDFEWVVMAIRIQREVGGNLSELLTNVAATIREREYLERQVQALSAEGRLSVWILGGLPPGFMAYLMVANRSYLEPLISTTLGFVLLGVMAVLLTAGIFWMKKLVKVDV